ncbi:MAG TPA: EAL domain-containing protein [Thermoleophilaceae bacterium]|jgi:PAS domain S-box-containing protein
MAHERSSFQDGPAANGHGGRGVDLVDRLGDMISAHSPDGTYTYVSAAAKELLGYEPGELVGLSAYDLLHPDDAAAVGLAHRSALEGAPFTLTYRLRRRNGDYAWVETTTRIVPAEEGGEVQEILCCTRPVEQRLTNGQMTAEDRERCRERVSRVLTAESVRTVFQPIVELATGRVIAYEALSRFPGDPSHATERWFADAWGVGLGVPLELLAARQAAEALEHLPEGVGLSINASPPTVVSEGFLQSLGDAADRVTVEITEHLAIEDYDEIVMKLASLSTTGGQVAIDDFGAGYASLKHVLRVIPGWIKLDLSLTERIGESPVAHALAAALVTFADETGVKVIAEGIETAEQVRTLTEIGIRYGQGFHFGRPASLEEVLRTALAEA